MAGRAAGGVRALRGLSTAARPRRRSAARAGATARPASRRAPTAPRPPRRTRRAPACCGSGPSRRPSAIGSGARKWTVRSIVGAGASARSRGHGAGNHASASSVTAAASSGRSSRRPSQPPTSRVVRAAEQRRPEAVLEHHPLDERRRRSMSGTPRRPLGHAVPAADRRRASERRPAAGSPRRSRTRPARGPSACPPARGGRSPRSASDPRARPCASTVIGPGLRRPQEMHRAGARHPFGIADRLLERPQHQRHHVAAERAARRPPSAADLALVAPVTQRAQRDVVVEAQGGARYSGRLSGFPQAARNIVRAHEHRASTAGGRWPRSDP